MKQFFFVIALLLFFPKGSAQDYFETSWISNGVKYTALVVFYDVNDAIVRVKYYNNGADKLAGFNCSYQEFTKIDGTKDRFLNGTDATIVRGPSGSSYSADNFYLKEKGDGTYSAYTVDDNGFNGGDITQYMKPMLYWVKLNPEAVTKGYLDDYFDADEPLFQLLDFFTNGEAVFSTSFTAVNTLTYGLSSNEGYDDGIWSVVMSDLGSKAYTGQSIKESSSFPSEWIKKEWDKGYFITTMAYDTNKKKFVVIMSKRNAAVPQSWKKESAFPKDWVAEKWDAGYHITSMVSDGKEWYVVMDKNTGFGQQRWRTRYEIPKDFIKESWDEGYSLTSVTYGNGLWALCMSTNSNLGTQTWRTQYDYPIDWIREKSEEGYSISTIAYGNSMWFVVMSKGGYISSNRSTTYYNDLPVDWIIKNAN
ncbi:MAG: hypothetical protein ABGX00_05400 [Allomuricauda sp.]